MKWDVWQRDCCYCLLSKSCLTLCVSMDSSSPGSSVLGISQARILEWIAIYFIQGIFPIQGSNPHLLHWPHEVQHVRLPCPLLSPSKWWKSSNNKKERNLETLGLKNTVTELKNSVGFPKQIWPGIRKYQQPGGTYIRNYLFRRAKIKRNTNFKRAKKAYKINRTKWKETIVNYGHSRRRKRLKVHLKQWCLKSFWILEEK